MITTVNQIAPGVRSPPAWRRVNYTAEMVDFGARRQGNHWPVSGQHQSVALTQLVLWLGVMGVVAGSAALLIGGMNLVGLVAVAFGYLAAVAFALILFFRGFPHRTLGTGNIVTLGRMALIASVLTTLGGDAHPWLVVLAASVALALDGVDGFYARRENRVSDFGEKLDMEIDSAFTVVLAVGAVMAGTIGPLVLVLVLPRYIFVVAGLWLTWLNGSLPESAARKVICVVQVIALISLQVPGFWGVFTPVIVVIVGGVLLWSFGRDVVFLWRSHRGASVHSDR